MITLLLPEILLHHFEVQAKRQRYGFIEAPYCEGFNRVPAHFVLMSRYFNQQILYSHTK